MRVIQDDLTAEFARTAEDILKRVSTDTAVRREVDARGFSTSAWTAAAEAGWLEALLDESAGGLGLSFHQIAPIFAAAGRHLFAGPLAEHAVAAAFAASAAPPAARDRLLAALSGARLLAFADPEAAGEPGAEPSLTGNRLVGECEIVRFAQDADELLVVAGDGEHVALLLVRLDRPGVTVRSRPSLDPVSHTADVLLDDVAIDADDVVATGSAADAVLAPIRAGMRMAVAWELSGIADHVLDLAVEYAKQREQFGRPIGSFQALQHILAEMAREAFGLSRLCREAAAARNDADALEDASLVAKAHAASMGRSITEASLQVHGGIAFTMEHELHRYYKHVLALEGLYGEPWVLHERLGRRLLERLSDPWQSWSAAG